MHKSCVLTIILSAAVLPESEEQENPFNRWYGGEKEALRLFKERLNNEKKVLENPFLCNCHTCFYAILIKDFSI